MNKYIKTYNIDAILTWKSDLINNTSIFTPMVQKSLKRCLHICTNEVLAEWLVRNYAESRVQILNYCIGNDCDRAHSIQEAADKFGSSVAQIRRELALITYDLYVWLISNESE